MNHPLLNDICRRLRENVRRGLPDQCDSVMQLPASNYRDPDMWEREMREIFLKVPILVALSCDIPQPA